MCLAYTSIAGNNLLLTHLATSIPNSIALGTETKGLRNRRLTLRD